MPKQRLTREMVVQAAFDIAREQGMEQVLVKNLADRLNCSTQPIYSYAKNMEELRLAVEKLTLSFVDDFVRKRIDPDDLFRSIGRTHITFAREEPHLFRIFILQSREGIGHLEQLMGTNSGVDLYIAHQLGITTEKARQLHLQMLIFTTGLGTIFISAKPGISLDEILAQQDLAYTAFLKMAKEKN